MAPTANKIFGTDGVRGRANVEPVTAETALKLGRAAPMYSGISTPNPSRQRHRIVIGKDTRLSGYRECLLAASCRWAWMCCSSARCPPGVARITNSLRADAGIVITASHNPYDDNGIKFFNHDGQKLADPIEEQIENLVFSGEIDDVRPTAEAIGKAVRTTTLSAGMSNTLNALFRAPNVEGVTIVVDWHGAAYKATPCTLRELGANVIVYGNRPDGTNINAGRGSMHPEQMCHWCRNTMPTSALRMTAMRTACCCATKPVR